MHELGLLRIGTFAFILATLTSCTANPTQAPPEERRLNVAALSAGGRLVHFTSQSSAKWNAANILDGQPDGPDSKREKGDKTLFNFVDAIRAKVCGSIGSLWPQGYPAGGRGQFFEIHADF